MVNPNLNWSSDKESDDDEKTTDKRAEPSRSFRPMPIPVERITPPPAPQEGIMYNRATVSVPLSELIARHAEVKLPDDDDEEDEDEQDDSYARSDSSKAAEAPEPLTDEERQVVEQVKADRAEDSYVGAIEHDAAVQSDTEEAVRPAEQDDTYLQPVLVEAAPEPTVGQPLHPSRPSGATYRSVHARDSVSAQPAVEAPAPVLQAAEVPADLRPLPSLNPFETQSMPAASHTEAANTPLQYAQEAAYAPAEYMANAAPLPADNDTESHFSVPNLVGSVGPANFDSSPNVHLGYRDTPAANPEQVTVNARDRRLGPAIFIAMGVDYAARRRMKKQNAAEHKQIRETQERSNDQQQQFAAEQQRFGQEQQRTVQEQQQQAAVLENVRAQQRESMANMPLTYAEQSQVDRVDQQVQQVRAEQPRQVIQPESRPFEGQRPAGPTLSPERPLSPVVLAPEAPRQPSAEQQQAVPQEQAAEQAQEPVRRIEDGWLWRDVNKRGEVVETNRTYGEAYHQERQQEIVQDRTGDSDSASTGSSTAATGYAAGGGAASMGYAAPSDGLYTQSQQAQPHQYSSLPSGMTTPSLPQGQHTDPQHQLQAGGEPEGQQERSNISNPWFWLMLMLIVAAFFTAALI